MSSPPKEERIDRSPPQGSATTRYNVTTHVIKRQKEVTVAMADGRYAKNEIVVHLTGLQPDFDIEQAIKETASAMRSMQAANPISLPLSKSAKQLVDKTLKAGQKAADEAGELEQE